MLFLLAMGVGLGTFINQSAAVTLSGVSYLVFLAPGLLASNAMQVGANESMWPVMASIAWNKTFLVMVSAPLAVADVVLGQALWLMTRLLLTATAFVVVMVIFGATDVARGLLMIPVAVATGLAFGLPITAFTATQRRESIFAAINRFVIVPLFIFSGVFFPITQLPPLIQPIAYLTPLWHGVALARAIALDVYDPVLASVNVTVLTVYIALGLFAAMVTFRRRLTQ